MLHRGAAGAWLRTDKMPAPTLLPSAAAAPSKRLLGALAHLPPLALQATHALLPPLRNAARGAHASVRQGAPPGMPREDQMPAYTHSNAFINAVPWDAS
eukprot:230955-Chlamydomonas_euryale.AAC.10